MNISHPDALKSPANEQVAVRGYSTTSEYICDLIQKERDRQRLRRILLDGAQSAPAAPADPAYFEALRIRTRSA